MDQRLKPLTAMQETWVRSLGQEDPLEKEMAMHSSILAWRIPWTEGPGGLQSTGSQRVGLSNFTHSLTHLHRGRLSFFSASARTIPYTNRAPRIHPPTHAGHLEGAAQSTSVFCPCLGILSISPRPWLLLQEGMVGSSPSLFSPPTLSITSGWQRHPGGPRGPRLFHH